MTATFKYGAIELWINDQYKQKLLEREGERVSVWERELNWKTENWMVYGLQSFFLYYKDKLY